MPTPSVARMVHYSSYGTPGGEYVSQCRAAVIADVHQDEVCDVVVFNPTGVFFNKVPHIEPVNGTIMPGSWHWPERVE